MTLRGPRFYSAIALTVLGAVLLNFEPGTSTFGVATAALAIAALVLVVHLSAGVAPRTLTVGARALAHSQVLRETPAPSHPTTAGRPLGRAPTGAIAAA